jgi:hypothetical protein
MGAIRNSRCAYLGDNEILQLRCPIPHLFRDAREVFVDTLHNHFSRFARKNLLENLSAMITVCEKSEECGRGQLTGRESAAVSENRTMSSIVLGL